MIDNSEPNANEEPNPTNEELQPQEEEEVSAERLTLS